MQGCPKSCATNSAPIPPKEGVTEIGGVVTAGTVVTLSVELAGGCVVVVVVVVLIVCCCVLMFVNEVVDSEKLSFY